MLKLREINDNDIPFLYEMLRERTPEQSISFKMPTFSQHTKFVKNNPYTAWYIIEVDGQKIGNIYLTENDEWGYFIRKDCQGLGYGTRAMKMLVDLHPRDYYYANINPKNAVAIHQARVKWKGDLIQITYKIPKENILV